MPQMHGAGQTHAFARLCLFPGVYHCGAGDGETEFDVLSPLMAWGERGQAPATWRRSIRQW